MPTHLVAHLYFFNAQPNANKIQKSHQANAPRQTRNDNKQTRQTRRAAGNSGFA